MALIDIKGVTKRFGNKTVLDNIDLTIPEGDIFGIIGINGSGKTTLLRLLIGYYKPTTGTITYKGKNLTTVLKHIKKEFGFTTQDNSFYPQLTVEENITYFGSLYGLSKEHIRRNMNDILILVELDNARSVPAEHLSGGMQRRLDMACSIIHSPHVLILDEPTEDLDPILRREILRLIKRINDLGTTVIITSHLLDDVETICQQVAILHNNSIVKVGSVNDIKKLYKKKEEIHIELASHNYKDILGNLNIDDYLIEDGILVVYTDKAEHTLHQILHIIEHNHDNILYVDMKKPSLQEVFNTLTNKKWLENF